MRAKDGVELLKKAKENTEIDRLYQFYCANFIYMKERKPFNELLTDLKRVEVSKSKRMTKNEIIAMAENIRNRHLIMQKQIKQKQQSKK